MGPVSPAPGDAVDELVAAGVLIRVGRNLYRRAPRNATPGPRPTIVPPPAPPREPGAYTAADRAARERHVAAVRRAADERAARRAERLEQGPPA